MAKLNQQEQMEFRQKLIENARRGEMLELADFLRDSRISKEEKFQTLEQIKELERLDRKAGTLGKFRREDELLNRLRIPPKEIIPQKRPVPIPIIMSSDRARKKFQENIQRLQSLEQGLTPTAGSTPVLSPINKPKENLRGVI